MGALLYRCIRNGTHTFHISLSTDLTFLQGMDLSHIEIVVQWKATTDMCMLWQRFGRGARGVGITGVAILLVEKKDTQDERRSKAEKAARKKAKEGIGTKRKAQEELHRGDKAAKRPILGDRGLPNSENLAVLPMQTPADIHDIAPSRSIEELKEERRALYVKRAVLETSGPKKFKGKSAREIEVVMDDFINAKQVGFNCRRVVPMLYFGNDKTRKLQ